MKSASLNPTRNAAIRLVKAFAAPPWIKPTNGIAGCCACVASGHATAVPPSADMNCRLTMPFAICAVRNGFSLAARISRPNRKVCDVLLRDPHYFCRGCARQKAAQSGRARWRQSRQLSEVKRTSLIGADVAVIDPKRRFPAIIFRAAKGSFNCGRLTSLA
jgi:hypothetical protein